jgi:hypothetical protein
MLYIYFLAFHFAICLLCMSRLYSVVLCLKSEHMEPERAPCRLAPSCISCWASQFCDHWWARFLARVFVFSPRNMGSLVVTLKPFLAAGHKDPYITCLLTTEALWKCVHGKWSSSGCVSLVFGEHRKQLDQSNLHWQWHPLALLISILSPPCLCTPPYPSTHTSHLYLCMVDLFFPEFALQR